MGKSNPNYFPHKTVEEADTGKSIIEDFKHDKSDLEKESETEENPDEKCPSCNEKVPEMQQLFNEKHDSYFHVGCFPKKYKERSEEVDAS